MENEITKEEQNQYLFGTSSFGDFKVYLINKEREINWRTRKAKELFAYFIHVQGKPVERNELILRLWPDSYPENSVKLLHNLIYSIRKEAVKHGVRELIQYDNRKYFMDMDYVYNDLGDMLYLSEVCKTEKKNTFLYYQRFLDGYRGAYLDNIDCDWCFHRREYFEQIYLRGCRYIADGNRKDGDYEQALYYLNEALQVDPYSENTMVQILKCLGEVKDLKSIKRYYKKYEDLIDKEFKMKPGHNLNKIYQECIRHALA